LCANQKVKLNFQQQISEKQTWTNKDLNVKYVEQNNYSTKYGYSYFQQRQNNSSWLLTYDHKGP